MPAKNTRTVPQWQRNALGAAIMLGLFGMANTSSGETTYGGSSSVPPTAANSPAAGNMPRDATNSGGAENPKNNSVVFRKKNRAVNKPANCGSNGSCGAQKIPPRPRRSADSASGVGVSASANNKKQAAKVRVKVPF